VIDNTVQHTTSALHSAAHFADSPQCSRLYPQCVIPSCLPQAFRASSCKYRLSTIRQHHQARDGPPSGHMMPLRQGTPTCSGRNQ
jgi:hypothetical protein